MSDVDTTTLRKRLLEAKAKHSMNGDSAQNHGEEDDAWYEYECAKLLSQAISSIDAQAARIAELEEELSEVKEHRQMSWDAESYLQKKIAELEAELLRVRTTEHAAAHALDVLRQRRGLDLVDGEHPKDTSKRIGDDILAAENEAIDMVQASGAAHERVAELEAIVAQDATDAKSIRRLAGHARTNPVWLENIEQACGRIVAAAEAAKGGG